LAIAWAGPENNSLVIGTSQEPEGFNVWENAQVATTNIIKMVFVGLIYFDADGNLKPGLATEVPTQDNGRFQFIDDDGDGTPDKTVVRWTIHDDANWHDGLPVTSQDVEFSFQVNGHPLIPNSKNLVQRISNFEIIDDKNFVIEYQGVQPFVTQPGQTGLLQNVEAQPRHVWEPFFTKAIEEAEGIDDAEARADVIRQNFIAVPPATSELGPVVGNGPFIFQEWQPGNFVRLKRNPDFFRNPDNVENYVQEVIIRFIENTPTLQVNVINGEVDATTTPGLGLDEGIVLQRFSEAAGFEVVVPPGDKWERLHLNLFDIDTTRDLQLDDPRTRAAIAHAIDRQGLVDTLFGGLVRVGHSFILSGDTNFKADIQTYDFDPEGAKAILSDLGWAAGPDGILQRTTEDGRTVRFELEYKTTAGNATRERIQEFFQANMRDIGIDVVIDNLPSSSFFSRDHFRAASEGAWTGAIQFFSTLVPVRNDGFWLYSDRNNTPTLDNNRSGRNLGGWDNEEFNQLQVEVETTPPGPERKALLDRMQEIYAAELPIIGIYERADPYTFQSGLVNYRFSTFETSLSVEPWNWGWEQNGAENVNP
jgi:peptide/nickel transport system substrate-binding protein